MNPISCIATLRPMDDNCPSLFKENGEYIYPKILRELVAQQVFSKVVLSIAPDTPQKNIDTLTQWGFPYVVGERSLPHLRVADYCKSHGLDIVCCISAYTYFFDKELIRETMDNLISGDHSFSGPDSQLSNLEFCILRKPAIDHLSTIHDRIIVPSKPLAVSLNSKETLSCPNPIKMHSLSEELIWILSYGEGLSTVPPHFIADYYASADREDWFSRRARERYSVGHFNIPAIDWADDLLKTRLLPLISIFPLANQLRWPQRIEREIPRSGERFLELGFGELPLISYYFSHRFQEIIAVEPSRKSAAGLQEIEELYRVLRPIFAYLGKGSAEGPRSQIMVHNGYLEDLDIKPESIDCCTSKTVFEHVENVEELSRELYRILKPGAVMLHEIDFSDHSGGSQSGIHFSFLKYSRKEWQAMNQGTNLLRISDFVALWKSIGFSVEVIQRIPGTAKPTEIDDSWSTYSSEDLLCQSAIVKATKPA